MAKSKNIKTTPNITPAATPVVAPAARSEVKGSASIKPPVAREITREQIEARAYQIYASRGYAQGDPTADWLEAERQLRAGL